MKVIIAAISASLLFTASAGAMEPWQDKAVELAKEEKKVRDAIWSQDISFWIGMDDDGSSRDGFAQYMCFVLDDAGRPEGEYIAITAWDFASMATDSPKQIGKAYCK